MTRCARADGKPAPAFRPEFLNRVDATIVFRALTQDEITRSSTWK